MLKIICLMEVVIATLPCFGMNRLAPANYTGRSTCVMDPSDPYDPGLAMPFGADRGHCADTHEERVPVILSEDAETLTIANFRHARRWWIATIPKHGVQNTIFQLAQFTGWQGDFGGAHGQIRFVMKQNQPVLLREQRTGRPYQGTAIGDFLFSAESFNAVGLTSGGSTASGAAIGGIWDSTHGRQGVVTRVVSMAERAMDELVKDGHNKQVIQTDLLLNQDQMDHLLVSGIRRSQQVGYTEVYDYLEHHCVSIALETLDNAFPPGHPVPGAGIGLIDILDMQTIIGTARNALSARNLIRVNNTFLLDNESANGQLYIPNMVNLIEDPVERAVLLKKLNERNLH